MYTMVVQQLLYTLVSIFVMHQQAKHFQRKYIFTSMNSHWIIFTLIKSVTVSVPILQKIYIQTIAVHCN